MDTNNTNNTNKKLGAVNEEELKKIADTVNDVAGGSEVVSAVTAVVSAVIGASWMLCPSGACTSTGYCK